MKDQKEDNPEVKIRIWMIRNGLNMVKIAKAYGSGRVFVYQLIHGLRTSKKLANFMIEMGCPKECFIKGRLAGKTTTIKETKAS